MESLAASNQQAQDLIAIVKYKRTWALCAMSERGLDALDMTILGECSNISLSVSDSVC
jgi:hypothetical protein